MADAAVSATYRVNHPEDERVLVSNFSTDFAFGDADVCFVPELGLGEVQVWQVM